MRATTARITDSWAPMPMPQRTMPAKAAPAPLRKTSGEAMAALAKVSGVGQSKLKRYGADVLKVVRAN